MVRSIKISILTVFTIASFMYVNFTVLAASTFIPLGGIITFVQYCTCTASILAYHLDFVTNSLVPVAYVPGYTNLYSNYGIYKPGAYDVSQYLPVSYECLEYDGESCDPIGIGYGIWYQVGTS